MEVLDVAGRNRGTARYCDSGDHRVAEIDRTPRLLAGGGKRRRFGCGAAVEVENPVFEFDFQ